MAIFADWLPVQRLRCGPFRVSALVARSVRVDELVRVARTAPAMRRGAGNARDSSKHAHPARETFHDRCVNTRSLGMLGSVELWPRLKVVD